MVAFETHCPWGVAEQAAIITGSLWDDEGTLVQSGTQQGGAALSLQSQRLRTVSGPLAGGVKVVPSG